MPNQLKIATKKYTLVGTGETSKQIATSGGITVKGIKVTGQSTSVAARLIDSANGAAEAGPGPGNTLTAANSGESFLDSTQFVVQRGIYFEMEQGINTPSEATIYYDD